MTSLPQAPETVSLSVYLLGPPRIAWKGRPLDVPRRQVRALLYRLAVRLEPLPRDQLCFLFWPDTPEATARRNLSSLLNHLRRALPEPELLQTVRDGVALDAERTWSDTVAFESLGHKEAVHLYRDPFLAGLSLPGSPEFESWVALEQRTWERRYLEALATLVKRHATRDELDAAIGYARRYLEVDDLAEDVHRRLITLYAAAGDRNAASRQYERCAIVLERELGVSPLPQTRATYRAVLEQRTPSIPKAAPSPKWTTLPSLDAPLVGREEALACLERAYVAARTGRGRAMLISGEPGIGKSRLLQEFVAELAGEVTLLVSAAHTTERILPYWPLIEALRPHLRGMDWATLGVDPAHLAEVARLLPELKRLFPDLSVPPPDRLIQQGRLFRALTRCLLGLASAGRPLLLCVDNLHWADSATLSYLGYLMRHLDEAPVLLLGTYRSGEQTALAGLRSELVRARNCEEVRLQGLSVEAVARLLKHLSGQARAAERYSRRLHRETGGNPFFLLEILRAMFEVGILTEEASGWQLAPERGRHADLPLPDTVTEAIRERLAHLDAQTRQILEAGAVLGYRFAHDLVWHTSGRREHAGVAALDLLVDRQILVEEGKGYHFAHDLIRGVVYEDLSYGRRRLLHRRSAEALEALRPDDVTALAYHFERAEELEKAIAYLHLAGERALRMVGAQEAAAHHSRALALLNNLPDSSERVEQELRLQIALGVALGVARGYADPAVGAAHRRARELARQLGDIESLFASLGLLLMYHTTRGEQRAAHEIGEELLAVAEQTGDPELLMISRWQLGVQQLVVGELVAAQDNLAWVVAHYDPTQHHPLAFRYGMEPGVMSRGVLALALWMLGHPDQALEQSRAARALARDLSFPPGIAMTQVFGCVVHGLRREWKDVHELAEGVLRISAEHKLQYWRTAGWVHQGRAQVGLGEVEEGLAQLHRGIDEGRALGAQMFIVLQLVMLAEAYAEAGQLQSALRTVEEALDAARETGERFGEPEAHRLKGELLLRIGAQIEAERYLRQAVALAREQGARALEVRAATALARVSQERR